MKLSAPKDLRQLPPQAQNHKKAFKLNIEINTAFCTRNDEVKVIHGVLISALLILDGFIEGKSVNVLKHDTCNTTVMSSEFSRRTERS